MGLQATLRLVVLLLALLGGPHPAAAQLISPGKLSSPHAELEGLSRCTSCHELRSPGIAPERCLACHEALGRRVAAGVGLHSGNDYRACATCHRDHLGRDYALIRWDPDSLDHAETGFELAGAHGNLDCRDCHRAALVRDPAVRLARSGHGALDRTYLGLGTRCVDCHESDDPHEGAFEPSPCSDCHDEVEWEAASRTFDHDRTRYPLTGRHRTVACGGCHVTDSFRAVRFAACSDCHHDPHGGAMTASCASCHDTGGWERVDRAAVEAGFDHDRVFPLEQAHAAADCASCHAPGASLAARVRILFQPGTESRAWPSPRTDSGCRSCHLDLHGGELDGPAGPAACDACHTQAAWYPSTFDVARHRSETSFPLSGAHEATPCAGCHDVPPGEGQFGPRDPACAACHGARQPHGDQFGETECDACHGTASFRVADFDHAATSFPLEGAHATAACGACHPHEPTPDGGEMVRFRPVDAAECSACHDDGLK